MRKKETKLPFFQICQLKIVKLRHPRGSIDTLINLIKEFRKFAGYIQIYVYFPWSMFISFLFCVFYSWFKSSISHQPELHMY